MCHLIQNVLTYFSTTTPSLISATGALPMPFSLSRSASVILFNIFYRVQTNSGIITHACRSFIESPKTPKSCPRLWITLPANNPIHRPQLNLSRVQHYGLLQVTTQNLVLTILNIGKQGVRVVIKMITISNDIPHHGDQLQHSGFFLGVE